MEGQRILSTRTPREAVTMYVITAVTMFILLLLVTLPCLGGALLWPELQQPGADRELVYGRLMKEFLPVGGMGLMIAAMLAAAMSTVADNLNFGSQVLVSDIYRRWFRPVASERHYLLMGKLGMLLILAIALAVAFNVFIINDVAIFMLQLSSAELSANWAQWWWWRFNGAARIAASVGGAVIFCIVVLGPKLLIFLGFNWAEKLIPAWWWQAFLVMGLTTALWITVALLTKPDPDSLLRQFHKRAQPLGWWGPFQNAASSTSGNQFRPIGKGILIATLGAGATSIFIIALSLLWLGRYVGAVAAMAGAAIAFLIFHKLTNQYLAFLANRTDETDSVANSQLITEKS